MDLRAIEVRPVHTPAERRRWDELVARHHYLPYHGLFGRALRHVAVLGETWLALVGWQGGAFKVGVRDRWIGWTRDQQYARLHLLAHNARYVVLPSERPKNLASRVLGLSLRRLCDDMQEIHGYPVWLAETFVDPSRFAGTCYRASNWRSLGLTRGYGRVPGASPNWLYHGQPKEVYVYSLTNDCRDQLCGTKVPGCGRFERTDDDEGPSTEELESLHAHLSGMKDFRRARGQRYSLACYFTLMMAARLAGYRGITAFGQYVALLSQEQLAAAGAFWSPKKVRYTAPAASSFHYVLAQMPPKFLDEAVSAWVQANSSDG